MEKQVNDLLLGEQKRLECPNKRRTRLAVLANYSGCLTVRTGRVYSGQPHARMNSNKMVGPCSQDWWRPAWHKLCYVPRTPTCSPKQGLLQACTGPLRNSCGCMTAVHFEQKHLSTLAPRHSSKRQAHQQGASSRDKQMAGEGGVKNSR